MATTTPYSKQLGDRDPIVAMRENADRVKAITKGWSAQQFDRPWAPGKWTGRQILTHLAQTELALGNRARMALAIPNYQAQSFNQDVWIAQESGLSGPEAVDALVALARMNASFFAALSPSERERTMVHPEYGAITVDWILHLLPGHQLNHIPQLEAIAGP